MIVPNIRKMVEDVRWGRDRHVNGVKKTAMDYLAEANEGVRKAEYLNLEGVGMISLRAESQRYEHGSYSSYGLTEFVKAGDAEYDMGIYMDEEEWVWYIVDMSIYETNCIAEGREYTLGEAEKAVEDAWREHYRSNVGKSAMKKDGTYYVCYAEGRRDNSESTVYVDDNKVIFTTSDLEEAFTFAQEYDGTHRYRDDEGIWSYWGGVHIQTAPPFDPHVNNDMVYVVDNDGSIRDVETFEIVRKSAIKKDIYEQDPYGIPVRILNGPRAWETLRISEDQIGEHNGRTFARFNSFIEFERIDESELGKASVKKAVYEVQTFGWGGTAEDSIASFDDLQDALAYAEVYRSEYNGRNGVRVINADTGDVYHDDGEAVTLGPKRASVRKRRMKKSMFSGTQEKEVISYRGTTISRYLDEDTWGIAYPVEVLHNRKQWDASISRNNSYNSVEEAMAFVDEVLSKSGGNKTDDRKPEAVDDMKKEPDDEEADSDMYGMQSAFRISPYSVNGRAGFDSGAETFDEAVAMAENYIGRYPDRYVYVKDGNGEIVHTVGIEKSKPKKFRIGKNGDYIDSIRTERYDEVVHGFDETGGKCVVYSEGSYPLDGWDAATLREAVESAKAWFSENAGKEFEDRGETFTPAFIGIIPGDGVVEGYVYPDGDTGGIARLIKSKSKRNRVAKGISENIKAELTDWGFTEEGGKWYKQVPHGRAVAIPTGYDIIIGLPLGNLEHDQRTVREGQDLSAVLADMGLVKSKTKKGRMKKVMGSGRYSVSSDDDRLFETIEEAKRFAINRVDSTWRPYIGIFEDGYYVDYVYDSYLSEYTSEERREMFERFERRMMSMSKTKKGRMKKGGKAYSVVAGGEDSPIPLILGEFDSLDDADEFADAESIRMGMDVSVYKIPEGEYMHTWSGTGQDDDLYNDDGSFRKAKMNKNGKYEVVLAFTDGDVSSGYEDDYQYAITEAKYRGYDMRNQTAFVEAKVLEGTETVWTMGKDELIALGKSAVETETKNSKAKVRKADDAIEYARANLSGVGIVEFEREGGVLTAQFGYNDKEWMIQIMEDTLLTTTYRYAMGEYNWSAQGYYQEKKGGADTLERLIERIEEDWINMRKSKVRADTKNSKGKVRKGKAKKVRKDWDDDEWPNDIDDEFQPDEDDVIISPAGSLGSKMYVNVLGKYYDDYDVMEADIMEWMDINGVYPTIWWRDDHGGMMPYYDLRY